METQPSAQSCFQKLNFDINCQKVRKIKYEIFEVLSNFTVFPYFVPNFLSMIVWANKFLAVTWHTWIYGHFL